MSISIAFTRLPHAADLPAPRYESAGAAGLDLVAAVLADTPIAPGQRALIPTGLQLEIPQGFEGQVRPRSGLALKHGVTVLNTPGTIDSDYRGEVGVILVNLGDTVFTVTRAMRIAQLVVAPVTLAEFVERDALTTSARGTGGFGSTGS